MKYIYIRGNKEYPAEVKEALVKAGASKDTIYSFNNPNNLYYINWKMDNRISVVTPSEGIYDMLLEFGTEINIDQKYKFQVGETVRKSDTNELIDIKDRYYKQGKPYYKLFGGLPDIAEENLKKNIKFQPFDAVLVRQNKTDKWTVDIFSHCDDDRNSDFVFVGLRDYWRYCIPYEENKNKYGTTLC